jgi:hypothetical protein
MIQHIYISIQQIHIKIINTIQPIITIHITITIIIIIIILIIYNLVNNQWFMIFYQ